MAVTSLRSASGGTVTLLGVSHADDAAVARVRSTITATAPTTLVLEWEPPNLDRRRADPAAPPSDPFVGVVRPYLRVGSSGGPAIILPGLLPLLHAAGSSALASALAGGSYGGEFAAAVDAARAAGKLRNVIIGDRPLAVTLSRCGGHWDWRHLYTSLPTFIGGVVLPPGFIPSVGDTAGLLWTVAMRDWSSTRTALELLVRRGVGDGGAAGGVFWTSSSSLGRSAIAWNRIVLDELIAVKDSVAAADTQGRRGSLVMGSIPLPECSGDIGRPNCGVMTGSHATTLTPTTNGADAVFSADAAASARRVLRRRVQTAMNDLSLEQWAASESLYCGPHTTVAEGPCIPSPHFNDQVPSPTPTFTGPPAVPASASPFRHMYSSAQRQKHTAISPALPPALGSERDALLASALKHAPGTAIVGVVGASHVRGIVAAWESAPHPLSAELRPLLSPPVRTLSSAVAAAAPYVLVGGLLIGSSAALRRSAFYGRHRGVVWGLGVGLGGLGGVGVWGVVSGVEALHAHMAGVIVL